MKDFRQLVVWQKAHVLALDVYRGTAKFPVEERFGLTSQVRRAAASVPANIAEGYGRSGDSELRRFLNISAGSACELEYHLLLVHDLTFLPSEASLPLNTQVQEVKRMLVTFIGRLTPKP